MSSARPPRSTGSLRHHANSIDLCQERQVGNGKASNHADTLRTARMRAAASWAASRHQQRLHGGARMSRLRCLSKLAAAANAHSTQPVDDLKRAEVLPTMPPAAELVQPPLRANLPSAGIVRGGEHGSFTRGDEASSSHERMFTMHVTKVREGH